MRDQNWVSLFEYSAKYSISLSTLRRRIKAHSIAYKLENGKYYILDEVEKTTEPPLMPAVQQKVSETNVPAGFMEASVLASANRLVEELKAAYAKILQEKEEQIGVLKEEIVDLKMLVNLMEKQVQQKKEETLIRAPSSHNEFIFPEVSE
ncbi:MAG: DUF3972 domain-containing protein [Oligoflexia bacterium]|nr:DUF3972 domain-containing protein [Oligoflexia bacterium]